MIMDGSRARASGTEAGSVDEAEVAKFARMAARWWDPAGEMGPLHQMNPVRLSFLRGRAVEHFGLESTSLEPLRGLRVLGSRPWKPATTTTRPCCRSPRMRSASMAWIRALPKESSVRMRTCPPV